MGKSEFLAKIWSENLKGRSHVEEVGTYWRILFKQTLGKQRARQNWFR
jgi:hypothetical protein